MPAKNPRVMVVMEPPLYQRVTRFAEADGVSVSLKVRDLLKEAFEIYEDRYLVNLAKNREKSFDRKRALTVSQMRARMGLKR